jgi:hypothetical protein
MAFTLANWSEVSVSMNQGIITAAVATPSSDANTQLGSMNMFTYFSPTDTLATILASGYFLPVVIDCLVGDIIFVEGTDANAILVVLTSVPPTDITSGSITTGNYLNPALIEYVTATTITNAQLLALYDTPVQLVPAQGAGSLILVDKMVIDYKYLTAATAAGGAIAAQYANTAHGAGVAATATIAAATLNGFTANAQMTAGSVAIAQVNTAVENIGIYLSNATADFTTGGGSAVVYTYYRVLSPS